MKEEHPPIRGRGAAGNPPNRFETRSHVPDPEWTDPEDPAPGTEFLKDTSKSIITYNDSPDVGFDASVNPYRGCEHGCIYCYARPTHEYLGFSAGLDFETKILVKEDAPGPPAKRAFLPTLETTGGRYQRRDGPISAGGAPAGADTALPGGLG